MERTLDVLSPLPTLKTPQQLKNLEALWLRAGPPESAILKRAAHIQEDADGMPPADGVAIALQVVSESLRVTLHSQTTSCVCCSIPTLLLLPQCSSLTRYAAARTSSMMDIPKLSSHLIDSKMGPCIHDRLFLLV